jgi:hypothetical protein
MSRDEFLLTQAWNKPKGMFILKFLGSVNMKQDMQCTCTVTYDAFM